VDELRATALAQGLLPMRDQALAQVAAGTIAFEELRPAADGTTAPEVPVEPGRGALRR
jgi:hypothetical protein